jgi:signal transduction histidine kinase
MQAPQPPAPAGQPRPDGLLPRRAAWVACAAVAVFVLLGLVRRLPSDPALAGSAAAVALLAAAALPRVPARLVVPVAAVVAAGVAVLGSAVPSNLGWFAVCLLAGWCGYLAPRLPALLFLGGALVLFGAEQLWGVSDPGWTSWAVGTCATFGAALLVRRERGMAAELRAAQAGLTERARVEERNRIARELHDVIAHSLTVSLLHVAAARMAVRYDPDDAERALAEAERLGRETLDEVRSTVGLLRADARSGDDPSAPLPGISGLAGLVERFRTAGADVTFSLDGDPAPVPATVGLAVYRIVQEALTNAAKHAPGAPVDVRVAVGPAVAIRVASAGQPGNGNGKGKGNGLGLGSMRERAESLGGTLSAGPDGTGWLVRAELPLPAARRREVAP